MLGPRQALRREENVFVCYRIKSRGFGSETVGNILGKNRNCARAKFCKMLKCFLSLLS